LCEEHQLLKNMEVFNDHLALHQQLSDLQIRYDASVASKAVIHCDKSLSKSLLPAVDKH
jgi:hypothetical protein